MSHAWKINLPASQKMALLAMCDWANDEGGSLHPSISRIAERLSCSDRQAQRVVHSLIEAGWLVVIGNQNGGAPGQSRRYQLNVKRIETGDIGVTGDKLSRVTSEVETGDIHDARRVTSKVETGDMGVTLTTIEPSIEPPIKEESARKRASDKPGDVSQEAFDGWMELRRAKRAGKPTALVWGAMRREAGKAGLTLDEAITKCVEFAWVGFQADWYAQRNSARACQSPSAKASRHSGFESMDYTNGINDDGSF